MAMIDKARLESIINAFIVGKEGLYLLRAEVKGANRLEVEIDHDQESIGIELIVELTKFIEEHLDRDEEDFELEVSSAGLTSPLTTPRRYRKFIGKELELLLRSGRKELGTLLSVSDEGITLEVTKMLKPEGEKRKRPITSEIEVKYEEINRATYHLQF